MNPYSHINEPNKLTILLFNLLPSIRKYYFYALEIPPQENKSNNFVEGGAFQ